MHSRLILGGARSGKSRRALRLARQFDGERIFIATAEAVDAEMAQRIERHRAERGDGFRTVEAPLELLDALAAEVSPNRIVVVDCLTLWLSNLMVQGGDVGTHTDALTAFVAKAGGSLILVSNEVGLGLVPETPLGRAFRDAQGLLNQRLAAVCPRVELMAAGLPLTLKPGSSPDL